MNSKLFYFLKKLESSERTFKVIVKNTKEKKNIHIKMDFWSNSKYFIVMYYMWLYDIFCKSGWYCERFSDESRHQLNTYYLIEYYLQCFYFNLLFTYIEMDDCKDDHTLCPVWAQDNQCVINPGYMLKFCMKSCRVCTSGIIYYIIWKHW